MPEQLPCPHLYAGHDAGHYSLPGDVLKARETYRSLEAMPWPKPPQNAWETVQAVAVATVDALHDGTKLPDIALIEQARQAERVYADALDMMDLCFSTAVQRARDTLRGQALAIITDHLRPAHDATWQAYTDAHRVLLEHGETEPRRLLSAPSKVRKASDTCDLMANRYEAISAARSDLAMRCGLRSTDDPTGKYAAIRNYHELHPTRWATAKPAWHGLPARRYLDWMADHGGQLWMPTPDEQTEAALAELHIGNPLGQRTAA
ncbi:hypothetical protein EAO71_35265 [Streptomyces sp. ms191]|uniref:hypothetical protein n=1 Tax=Streptomyces sp. ms191 TaxID=1827978 RepID=UPI0011CD4006|nr:hypothetical protein [Streptomyces sp. ms191]TXS16044.1 hypothetical protein EAO71_35265 [Streptomyces sp. ms191]